MLRSLDGLSVGDAFGELLFSRSPHDGSLQTLPASPWPWTDDTHMARSIVEILELEGRSDQDRLAARFAARFFEQPFRGYARGAASLLHRVGRGEDLRRVSPTLFGSGSFGNGGAMRVAPLGAIFASDRQSHSRSHNAMAKTFSVQFCPGNALTLRAPFPNLSSCLRSLPLAPVQRCPHRTQYRSACGLQPITWVASRQRCGIQPKGMAASTPPVPLSAASWRPRWRRFLVTCCRGASVFLLLRVMPSPSVDSWADRAGVPP